MTQPRLSHFPRPAKGYTAEELSGPELLNGDSAMHSPESFKTHRIPGPYPGPAHQNVRGADQQPAVFKTSLVMVVCSRD